MNTTATSTSAAACPAKAAGGPTSSSAAKQAGPAQASPADVFAALMEEMAASGLVSLDAEPSTAQDAGAGTAQAEDGGDGSGAQALLQFAMMALSAAPPAQLMSHLLAASLTPAAMAAPASDASLGPPVAAAQGTTSGATSLAGASVDKGTPELAANAPAGTPPAFALTMPLAGAAEAARQALKEVMQDAAGEGSPRKAVPEAMPLTAPAPASAAADPVPVQAAANIHRAGISAHPMDPAFGAGLAAEVRFMMDTGSMSAQLRMNPPDLGPIQIQLHINAQTADLSFTASHAQTREGITQSLPALRDMLANQGLNLGQAGVSGGQDQRQQAQEGRQLPGPASARQGVDGTGGAPAALVITQVMRAPRGVLDIYA